LAREAAQSAGANVEWVEADMREIPARYAGTFDALINMFTAFGYFESQVEDQAVLDGVVRSLTSSGRFILDWINSIRVFRNYRDNRWQEVNSAIMATRANFDFLSGRNREEMMIIESDGTRRVTSFSVRQYMLVELAEMFGRAGLTIQSYWGDFDGSELTLDSRRLIILAQK
jgi:hypothetical protein